MNTSPSWREMSLLQQECRLSSVVDFLKATFEIQDNDTDQGIRAKVSKGLQALKVDEASTLPYLLDLLSVKESGIERSHEPDPENTESWRP